MTELKIHAEGLDGETLQQIYKIKNHPSIVGQIAIMPDAHAGAGCVIGTTCTFGDSIIPNVVGVDIGCGVLGVEIDDIEINFSDLDSFLKSEIPLGMKHRQFPMKFGAIEKDIVKIAIEVQKKIEMRKNPVENQIGTLGGGNHFIEVGQAENSKWIFIHSGSRNFGLTVAQYYQNMATKDKRRSVHKGMECLFMDNGGNDYLHDMKIAQKVAKLNRNMMMMSILDYLGIRGLQVIDTVHNYIADDGICRKGAISAYKGEKVLIPLNMRDGTVIGKGKGNPEYNFSAPHGAGRLVGRGAMKRKLASGELTVEAFQDEMIGIYTTTATAGTIDESPFAYKPFDMIKSYLEETVEIQSIVKPIYNLKGTE